MDSARPGDMHMVWSLRLMVSVIEELTLLERRKHVCAGSESGVLEAVAGLQICEPISSD